MPRRERGLPTTSARYSRDELAALDELLQLLVRLVRARDDHQPGRVAVEAVDDSRPLLLPARGAGERERMRERAAGVAGRRMDDDSGRLVDDEQMLVRVRDRQFRRRDIRNRRGRGPRRELDPLPTRELVALAERCPVHDDTAPASSNRSAAPREPTSGSVASQRSRRIPAASGGTSSDAHPRSARTSAARMIPTPITMKLSARLNAGQ